MKNSDRSPRNRSAQRRIAALTVALHACAITGAAAQNTVQPHPLGAPLAVATERFGIRTTARVLSDGRVLVNDGAARRLVLLDSNLTDPVVVLDSVLGKDNSYSRASSPLFAFIGDSSLFLDLGSNTFLVIDPNGKVARTMPYPGRTSLTIALSPLIAEGGMAYSSAFGLLQQVTMSTRPSLAERNAAPQTYVTGDSGGITATHMTTRKVDTVGKVATGRGATYVSTPGSTAGTRVVDDVAQDIATVFRVFDTWTVMRDGSIAIIRGGEYRLDWIDANGTRSSTARLPHAWQRHTDADKVRIADSINVIRTRSDSVTLSRWIDDSVRVATGAPPVAGAPPPLPVRTTARGSTANVRPAPRRRIAPAEIPDYLPALPQSVGYDPVMVGDADNNVWVQTRGKGRILTYDVFGRDGVLKDRIESIPTRRIVGFAPNGIVYTLAFALGGTGPGNGYTIERSRVK